MAASKLARFGTEARMAAPKLARLEEVGAGGGGAGLDAWVRGGLSALLRAASASAIAFLLAFSASTIAFLRAASAAAMSARLLFSAAALLLILLLELLRTGVGG